MAIKTNPNALRLITEVVKGHNSYSVVNAAGDVVAYAHCAHVKLGRYTLVIDGKWSGLGTEAAIVAALNTVITRVNATLSA